MEIYDDEDGAATDKINLSLQKFVILSQKYVTDKEDVKRRDKKRRNEIR